MQAGPAADEREIARTADERQAAGDWDGAIELLRSQSNVRPLSPASAWRYGRLLYLRAELGAAVSVMSSVYDEAATDADSALVSGWLSTALWALGDVDGAHRVAEVALRQADASRDLSARATAHVACALVARSRSDRPGNLVHTRAALVAAEAADDRLLLGRIHSNLADRAITDGDYAAAIRETDLALGVDAPASVWTAMAYLNRAEALVKLGDIDAARSSLAECLALYESLGASLRAAAPHLILGTLDLERGDLLRARVTLETALQLAERAGNVHIVVPTLIALARTVSPDEPDRALELAAEARDRTTDKERVVALCGSARIALIVEDRPAAAAFAREAEAAASRDADLGGLAEALALRAVASDPVDIARLERAVGLWEEVRNPNELVRARLLLAQCRGDVALAHTVESELAARGLSPAIGLAAIVGAWHVDRASVAIATLGRFAVVRAGTTVPLAEWRSRKSRDLLKMLVARLGRPVTREAVCEALWPEEDPDVLGNRLSVALSTVRKILDPQRTHPQDQYVAADARSITLRTENLDVDVMRFLQTARDALARAGRGDWTGARPLLLRAEMLYAGDFLAADAYEDWAIDCREEARSVALGVHRMLARDADGRGEDEAASQHLRRLLEHDAYDEDAWVALVGTQLRLRRHGEARRLYAAYARRMKELDVEPVPLDKAADARP